MKDIFLDTNLATNLVTPLTDPFKSFISWLFDNGALVINNQLRSEYICGNQLLATVIDRLQRDGRINMISSQSLKALRFNKKTEESFLSNKKDRVHIKTVLLSNRKIALALDNNLRRDINNLPKYNGIKPNCQDCPSKLNYKE